MSPSQSRIDVRARIVATVTWIVGVATLPRGSIHAITAMLVLACVATITVRPPLRWLASRVAIVSLWGSAAAAARVYGTIDGGWFVGLDIGLRVFATLVSALPLAATTSSVELAAGLHGLGLPALVSATIATSARGVSVLGAEARTVALARELRGARRGVVARTRMFGSFVATVLTRAVRRSEQTALAMDLRGYDPSKRWPTARRFGPSDGFVVGCAILAAIAVRWIP